MKFLTFIAAQLLFIWILTVMIQVHSGHFLEELLNQTDVNIGYNILEET